MMVPDRLDITWIVLIGLALAAALLPPLLPRPLANALVLALAIIKGRRIALDFLELRTVPALWRGLVSAWIIILMLFTWLASAAFIPI